MTIRDVHMHEPLPGSETMDHTSTFQYRYTEEWLDIMIELSPARILCAEIHADQPTV